MRATTSSLSWDEVVQAVAKTKGAREAAAAGEAFLAIPRLSLVPVDRKTLAAAQQVYAKYGLRPRDSIHAACAILEGEHEIYSVDSDFDRVKELKRREPR
jgi:predicted nucleic acid-binding protein